jgi:hypothetical protein
MPRNNNSNNNNNNNGNVREIDVNELVKEVRAYGVGNRNRLSGNLNRLPHTRANRTPPRFTKKARTNAPKKPSRRNRRRNTHRKHSS